MRLDPARLLGPLVAALVLVFIFQQTLGALRVAGVWGSHRTVLAPAAGGPFAQIDTLLEPAASAQPAASRDPFAFGPAAAPVVTHASGAGRLPPARVAPARPVLTSIVWLESNPSATLRWNGRDYRVQANTVFEDFLVQSIGPNQVTLQRGGETLVLQFPKKGD